MTRVLIITGPTATGKSALAVALAQQLDGEVVNADSQAVYRGCDIGTGKLPPAQRGGVSHHLLDVVEPTAQYNAAQFAAAATAVIQAIQARGRVAIVVGGTGLYLKSLVWGLCEAPPADPAARRMLEARLATHGAAALHADLVAIDPELAARIHPHHTSRVMRALEVWQLSGRSLRELQQATAPAARLDAIWVGLTCDRAALRERIAQRVAAQLTAGWLDEVRALVARHGPDAPALRAIGYRELAAHLQHGGDVGAVAAQIITATAQYAKRQMTYLRKIREITWFDMTQPDWESAVHRFSSTALNRK